MAYVEIKGYCFTVHPNTDAPSMYYKGDTLSDVYGSWSYKKQKAYDYCRKMFYDLDGRDFCITSANGWCFSVMFDFANPETGELMRAWITKEHNHLYYL